MLPVDCTTQTASYILMRSAIDEQTFCLQIWTRSYGKITGYFTPNRHFQKNQMGLLQPFTPLSLQWHWKQPTRKIRQIEVWQMASLLKGKRLCCAQYVNSLLLRTLPQEEAYPHLFEQYERTLLALRYAPVLAISLRLFEKRLLSALGYSPTWHADHQGRAIAAAAQYRFDTGAGFVRDHKGPFPGSALQAIADESFASREDLQVSRHILQAIIATCCPTHGVLPA